VVNKLHKTLTFHAWYPGCPMEEDAYGIPKPKDTEVIVPTLLFVPCVGYGPGGYRLGYGGGFYDRTLATLQPRPFTVGLGYRQGWLPDMEPEPHDIPLDAILNDKGRGLAGLICQVLRQLARPRPLHRVAGRELPPGNPGQQPYAETTPLRKDTIKKKPPPTFHSAQAGD
jgi:hypothetical protein